MREIRFATQVARVDGLITTLRADLLGVPFAHHQRSFRTLADTVRRPEARLRETFVLRLCFGVWAKVTRTAQSSKLGSGELLRRCLCAWSAVASQPRASLTAVLFVQQKVHEKLLAVDDDIGHTSSRIDLLQSPFDSDTEYHRRCVAFAEAVDEEVATIESL